MVVDNEPQILALLKRFLEAKGFSFVGALNADEAIKKFAEERPWIVFLDITLPDRNGLEVLQEFHRADPTVGVIMITGAYDDFLKNKVLEIGAFDFITKPFDFAHLEEVLRTNLDSKLPGKKIGAAP